MNLSAGVLKLEALDIIVDGTKKYPNGTTGDGHVMVLYFRPPTKKERCSKFEVSVASKRMEQLQCGFFSLKPDVIFHYS